MKKWNFLRFVPFSQPVLTIGATLLLTLAITRQSLWIDEAAVAWFASIPSLHRMAILLVHYDGSDPQMPLYLLYMRAWVQLFGRGEIVLRLSNLPFAVLLLASVSWTSTTLLKRPAAWLLLALSPFLWFYMNEARPYVALMGLAGAVTAGVLAYALERERYHRTSPSLAVLFFTAALAVHMLAAFLFVPLVAFLLIAQRGRLRVLIADWSRPLLTALPVLALEVGYYGWTIVHHAGGQRAATGFKNVLFVLYEMAGLAGLGPPRNDLRAATGSVLAGYLPWLALGVAALMLLGVDILFSKRSQTAQHYWVALSLGFAFALMACHVAHFRFLGRHLAVFFPMIFLGILMVTRTASRALSRGVTVAAFGLLAVAWTGSDLRLISLAAYSKDDYRAAVADAIAQASLRHEDVLWAADDKAAYYYGLLGRDANMDGVPGTGTTHDAQWPERQAALLARNSTAAQVCSYLSQHPAPVLLALGKPDVYDTGGSWRAVLRQPGAPSSPLASPNTFEIFQLNPRSMHAGLAGPGSLCAARSEASSQPPS